jgi:uncharacterized protein
MKKKPGRSAAKRSTKRTTKRATKRSSGKSSSRPRHVHTPGLNGWITHTELASSNPEATKAWCAKVLGWTFKPSVPMPDGDYHLFAYSDKGGGGIRATKPSETPGSTFTVHVADARASFEKALREGAEAVLAPVRVMEGVTIAVVRAPGGVPVGLSGP